MDSKWKEIEEFINNMCSFLAADGYNQSTFANLYAQASESGSDSGSLTAGEVVSITAQASASAANIEELFSDDSTLTISIDDDTVAELFKRKFSNTRINTREDYEEKMKVLASIQRDFQRSLTTLRLTDAEETRRNENLQKVDDELRMVTARFSWLIHNIKDQITEQKAHVLGLEAKYNKMKEIYQAKEERAQKLTALSAATTGNQENVDVLDWKRKLEEQLEDEKMLLSIKRDKYFEDMSPVLSSQTEDLNRRLKEQNEMLKNEKMLLNMKRDKYWEMFPVLSSQIDELNNMMDREGIFCPQCPTVWYPPILMQELDKWMKGVLATCADCIDELNRRYNGTNNALNQTSTATDNSDPPRILLGNERSLTSTDSDSDIPRILLPRK